MALRNIRLFGDEILEKKTKPVKENNGKLQILIDDMLETMHNADGVGLAAPQVGVLKRLVVVDVSDDGDDPYVLINPEVIYEEGEQTGTEGCLSYPGMAGMVTRPKKVKIKALDRNFNEYVLEGEDLLARAVMHELDHLEGHIYTERVIGKVFDAQDEEAEKQAEIEAGIYDPEAHKEEQRKRERRRRRRR